MTPVELSRYTGAAACVQTSRRKQIANVKQQVTDSRGVRVMGDLEVDARLVIVVSKYRAWHIL